ncbi:3712_t:CDS:2 [Racocetra persica]|uniref:3712_t:CDS:1 n=1 Tax=Racocetra persica TaxID=160502 RepID=A0ACA9P9T9_9GLOM|nr:3712_t:CDS:2 [Racocetra persica]
MLISLIRLNIANQEEKNKLITELEKLRVHLRRGFEEEIIMNQDGTTIYVDTINHCLLYAFGECYEQHTNRCVACDRLFEFIQYLMTNLKEHYSTIEECHEGEKIQTAIADLEGTSVANIEPIRNNHNVKTIAGITQLFYFEWPINGDYTRYIRARCLPHTGSWSQFSPFEISKLTTIPVNKPTPNITPHSIPKNLWNFSLSRKQEQCNNPIYSLLDVEEVFELKRGWALKSNQKYGKRGAGKRMTSTVKSYLEGYFLAGNVNKTDRMTAKDMVEQLQILAEEGEILVEDIPEVTKVAKWIPRYAASLKRHTAETAIEESNTTGDLNNSNQGTRKPNSEKGKKVVCYDNNGETVVKRQKRARF